ncbi:MAG: hypothetical protein AAF299_05415 [Pseudomonadota bacterium]
MGGVFLICTALNEIFHMLVEHDLHGENGDNRSKRTVFSASMWMLIMNVVLSFDTVSSATAPTDVFRLMQLSIVFQES